MSICNVEFAEMSHTIEHLGIVENIQGSRVSVRIVQTSACAACGAKGYCSAADSKEKTVDVTCDAPASYSVGQQVYVVGESSMCLKAVLLAFVVPFLLLVTALFLLLQCMDSELYAALSALALLIPYYIILWLYRERLKSSFSFMIKPVNR